MTAAAAPTWSQQLHRAAEMGDEGRVNHLLLQQQQSDDSGGDVNTADARGETALHKAARRGHTAVVAALLAAGAQVSPQVNLNHHWTPPPLQWAVVKGHAATVRVLLEAGASVCGDCSSGTTPLHCAAGRGHADVVAALLAAGAGVDAADSSGRSALHRAAAAGHASVVGVLLSAGANVTAADKRGATPLLQAALLAHTSVVQLLVGAGAAISAAADAEKINQALHDAAFWDRPRLAQALLAAGADVNAGGRENGTPLECAARQGSTQTIKLMLAAPKLDTDGMVRAAGIAASEGRSYTAPSRAKVVALVLKALMRQDPAAAATVLANRRWTADAWFSQQLVAEMLGQWQAAEDRVMVMEAQKPELQQLLIGIAGAHNQLRTAAAAVRGVVGGAGDGEVVAESVPEAEVESVGNSSADVVRMAHRDQAAAAGAATAVDSTAKAATVPGAVSATCGTIDLHEMWQPWWHK